MPFTQTSTQIHTQKKIAVDWYKQYMFLPAPIAWLNEHDCNTVNWYLNITFSDRIPDVPPSFQPDRYIEKLLRAYVLRCNRSDFNFIYNTFRVACVHSILYFIPNELNSPVRNWNNIRTSLMKTYHIIEIRVWSHLKLFGFLKQLINTEYFIFQALSIVFILCCIKLLPIDYIHLFNLAPVR